MRHLVIAGIASALLAGCAGKPPVDRATTYFPREGTLIPDTAVRVAPGFNIALDKIVYWGAYAAAAYLILDPLAPNWEIEEARFPEDQVHLSLQMRRFYAGGAGEARAVFHRRARELARLGGYPGYDVLEYSESLESSVLGSQRVAGGVIRLRPKAG